MFNVSQKPPITSAALSTVVLLNQIPQSSASMRDSSGYEPCHSLGEYDPAKAVFGTNSETVVNIRNARIKSQSRVANANFKLVSNDNTIPINLKEQVSDPDLKKIIVANAPPTSIPECHYFFEHKCVPPKATLTNDHIVIVNKDTFTSKDTYIKGYSYSQNVAIEKAAFDVQDFQEEQYDYGDFVMGTEKGKYDENFKWAFFPNEVMRLKAQNLSANEYLILVQPIKVGVGNEKSITIVVKGANNDAVISGENTGQVIEDDSLTIVEPNQYLETTGLLKVVDADPKESEFKFLKVKTDISTFEISPNGKWNYRVQNNHPKVQ